MFCCLIEYGTLAINTAPIKTHHFLSLPGGGVDLSQDSSIRSIIRTTANKWVKGLRLRA